MAQKCLNFQSKMLKSVFDDLFDDLINLFEHKGGDVDVTCFETQIHVLDVSTYQWYDSKYIRFFLKHDSIECYYDIPVAESDRDHHVQFKLIFFPGTRSVCNFTSADEFVETTYDGSICDVVCRICELPW